MKLSLSTFNKYFLLAVRLHKLHCAKTSQAKRENSIGTYVQGSTLDNKL